ncbi:amidase [Paraburkholderia atlantica]|uniref:amidase n=1 Tax=Paraburkholderia atlantica TaxID=2654982 RepID=UPI000368136C|nr:amidase [Paraburkholderia atlantica]
MSLPSDLHNLELHDLSLLIRSRKVSPVEVTQAQLKRIEALDGTLHSYARVTPDLALQQAKEAEEELMRGQIRSPIHGIPLAYKDLFDTAGIITSGGMPIHGQRIPMQNATAVQLMHDAGAVMLGKLQMTEGAFAINHPSIPDAVNPWGAGHWAGASSTGCGVATAARLCYGSLGTDTGGSIRFPAAANGLTGIKPTWGRVSRFGAFELASSLDHVGPIARSACDALILLAAVTGHDTKDSTSLPHLGLNVQPIEDNFKGLRIGVDESWISEGVDPVIQRQLETVIAMIIDAGGLVISVKVPDTRDVSRNWELHCGVQTAVAHESTYPVRASEYGPALSRLIDQGRELSAMDYQRILLEARRFNGAMDALLCEVDLILAPVQPYAAPTFERLADLAGDPEANRRLIQFTAPFNVSGHPAMAFPIGFTENGMPIGGQFIGRKYGEVTVARAGMAIQKVTDWHRQAPTNFK